MGSTGSIGTQALQVVSEHPDLYEVRVLTANTRAAELIGQALRFNPDAVVIADESKYPEVSEALKDTTIKVYAGRQALKEVVEMDTVDIVLTATVGISGLEPTVAAIKAGKQIALANKETLVVAGDIVTRLAVEHRAPILPVDSEHSAIFQCLVGERDNEPVRLLLTASGGPFLRMDKERLASVTAREALHHPTWKMGDKITIDSATMMNKGFEVIEAVHLFGVLPEQIEVLVHRESIMHSAVEYTDHSVIAQMSVPDMRLCVQYALTHPMRAQEAVIPELDLLAVQKLTFASPDTDVFPLLALARSAIASGGAVPAVLNAANEVAVAAFLAKEITFPQIAEIVTETVEAMRSAAAGANDLDSIFACDAEARTRANERKRGGIL